MKNWRHLIVLGAYHLILCASNVLPFPEDPCPVRPDSYDDTVNYFAQNQALVSYAQYFTLAYTNSYKILTITATTPPTIYVLYLCNNPQPNVTGLADATYVQVPVKSAAFADMPSIRFVERFGQGGSVTSATNLDDITSPCMMTAVTNASIHALPPNGVPPVPTDILFAQRLFPATPGLPPQVPTLFYQEANPLARFEWIKLFATFYNLDGWTNRLFDRVAGEYKCIVNGVAAYEGPTNTTVAWLKFENERYICPDEMYTQALIKDGDGTPVAMPASGYFADAANMQQGIVNADFLIDNTALGGASNDTSVPIQDGVYSFESFQSNFGMNFQAGVTPVFKFYNNRAVFRTDKSRTASAYDSWPLWYHAQPVSNLLDMVEMIHGPYTNMTAPTYLRNISVTTDEFEFIKPNCDVPLYQVPDLPATSCQVPLGDADTVQPPLFGWVPDSKCIFGTAGSPVGGDPGNASGNMTYAEMIAAVVLGISILSLIFFALAWWCFKRGRQSSDKQNFPMKMPAAVKRHLRGSRPNRDADGSRSRGLVGASARGTFPVLTGGTGRWQQMPEDKTTIFDASPWDDVVSTCVPSVPVRVIVEEQATMEPLANTAKSRQSTLNNVGKTFKTSTTFKEPPTLDAGRHLVGPSSEDELVEEIEMKISSPGSSNPWRDGSNHNKDDSTPGLSGKTFGKEVVPRRMWTKFGRERGEGEGFAKHAGMGW
ncbi:hypothetical protein SeMB42_g02204 [Synchytrium endobioticum]|uniref:Uncharacterized protein n=1 Tax=Synchytrium endobioticum TaxID=286115 RepID=A0A507DFZ4_9FUNG|nr:hypothetical protein SeLEV6574_g01119 [Synchytrium endobioticum]TPX50582.1 hypothetical protein SeMB42_g02204 [Synchytrium endobioticum]